MCMAPTSVLAREVLREMANCSATKRKSRKIKVDFDSEVLEPWYMLVTHCVGGKWGRERNIVFNVVFLEPSWYMLVTHCV